VRRYSYPVVLYRNILSFLMEKTGTQTPSRIGRNTSDNQKMASAHAILPSNGYLRGSQPPVHQSIHLMKEKKARKRSGRLPFSVPLAGYIRTA